MLEGESDTKHKMITALEEDIALYESLGQDVKGRKELLNKLKPKTHPIDPIWQALGGAPERWPGNG